MELIKVKNVNYGRYEELLLEKDKVIKHGWIYRANYMKEFGELITAVFEKKIECIKLKKTIAFCQAAVNAGLPINRDELGSFIAREMEEYNSQLKDLVSEAEAAQHIESISQADYLKIKKLYRKLSKLLHPDINPKTEEIPELMELWNGVVAAYNGNDLKALEELSLLINSVLEKLSLGEMDIEIPDIDAKIEKLEKEIARLKEADPYQYKYLLEDKSACADKKKELETELCEYTDYYDELNEVYKGIMESGASFIWQVN